MRDLADLSRSSCGDVENGQGDLPAGISAATEHRPVSHRVTNSSRCSAIRALPDWRCTSIGTTTSTCRTDRSGNRSEVGRPGAAGRSAGSRRTGDRSRCLMIFSSGRLSEEIGVALVAGPIGCFVIWRRLAYFGDTLSFGSAGLCHGAVAELNITLAVFFVCVAVSLLLLLLQRQATLSSDTLLGLLARVAGCRAGGAGLYDLGQGRPDGVPVR